MSLTYQWTGLDIAGTLANDEITETHTSTAGAILKLLANLESKTVISIFVPLHLFPQRAPASDQSEGGKGGGGGYRSRFTENKTGLSQFTKNITLAFHASRKIKENILENHGSRRLWKTRFTRKKRAISHFTESKKGRSRVTKIPFTTLQSGS